MESVMSLFANPAVLTAIFIGASVIVLVYILKLLKTEENTQEKQKNGKSSVAQSEKKKDTSGKLLKKKNSENRWTGRSEKGYSHPWLLTSLKGHTGEILDIDFSSNGKYLASCGNEDPDPGGVQKTSNSQEKNISSTESSPTTKGLSRRQKKNRKKEDSVLIEVKKKNSKKMNYLHKRVWPHMVQPRLNINESTFTSMLQSYLLSFGELIRLSYPVESPLEDGLVVSYNMLRFPQETKFNVYAGEFKPAKKSDSESYTSTEDETSSENSDSTSDDSGQGSGNSSDSGEGYDEPNSDNFTDPMFAIFRNKSYTRMLNKKYHEYFHNVPVERTCVRCKIRFLVTNKEYITMDQCCYHWGKFIYKNNPVGGYECCSGTRNSVGCTYGNLHVWNGTELGVNGPYEGFVRTKFRKNPPQAGNFGVYALDCEMCYTVQGLELTRVAVVNMAGKLVYDSYVKPEHEIVDYNTRFSGITAKDLKKSGVKTLKQVQNDLMGFISANTILIGHGLENDLRALKILHRTIVDTAYIFPHHRGLPYRRSLKNLAQCLLKIDIQTNGARGHDSYEDAVTCMELLWWRIYNDYKPFLL